MSVSTNDLAPGPKWLKRLGFEPDPEHPDEYLLDFASRSGDAVDAEAADWII